MSEYINWNGKIVNKNDFYISPDNRSFRYGDGFFETIKVFQLQISLELLHFERLFLSLELLKFDIPSYYSPEFFREQIEALLVQNKHTLLSRVRLMVYRGDGTLHTSENNFPNFVIQSWDLESNVNKLNSLGLKIDVYKEARKAFDNFSAVKSNNYLSFIMAGFFVTDNKLDDALILNCNNRIADSTIANVFIVKDGTIKTPPLSEACINGVYRRFLIQAFLKDKISFIEAPIAEEELIDASEIFLTNAIKGIRWVSSCGNIKGLKNDVSTYIYNKYCKSLFPG